MRYYLILFSDDGPCGMKHVGRINVVM